MTARSSEPDWEAVSRTVQAAGVWFEEVWAAIANAMQPAILVFERFAAGLQPRIPYRDQLEWWIEGEPWWSRASWRLWIRLVDAAGYHWENGPEPWRE